MLIVMGWANGFVLTFLQLNSHLQDLLPACRDKADLFEAQSDAYQDHHLMNVLTDDLREVMLVWDW